MSTVPEPVPDNSADDWQPPPGMRRSMEAYWRDLPQMLLLRSRKREWVAYHGDERIGFAKTQWELYDECSRRGIREDEMYIGRLVRHEAPPWEPIDMDGFGEGLDDEDDEAMRESAL